MAAPFLLTTELDNIGIVTLNKAHKRNALDEDAIAEIDAYFSNIPEHIRVILMKAEGDHFCAGLDLADLRGYAYYSGTRYAVYAPGASDALVRGGRYDEVGAVYGRNRPAAGFSLDIKQLVAVVPARPLKAAVRAPWGASDASLAQAIAALRAQGETVVCVLPGHESEVDEFHCDRELVLRAGQWVVQAF